MWSTFYQTETKRTQNPDQTHTKRRQNLRILSVCFGFELRLKRLLPKAGNTE